MGSRSRSIEGINPRVMLTCHSHPCAKTRWTHDLQNASRLIDYIHPIHEQWTTTTYTFLCHTQHNTAIASIAFNVGIICSPLKNLYVVTVYVLHLEMKQMQFQEEIPFRTLNNLGTVLSWVVIGANLCYLMLSLRLVHQEQESRCSNIEHMLDTLENQKLEFCKVSACISYWKSIVS